jgi:hypothetical protein
VTLPFTITVYDHAFRRKGWVGNPASVKVTFRHNAVSTFTFTIDADHPRAADLMAEGARAHFDYGTERVGGPVRAWSGSGPASSARLTFTVEDDWRLLTRVLGWAVPGAGVGGQTQPYAVYTGPAETAAKAAIAANANRLGLPVTVAPTQGRGEHVELSLRFHPLADRLFPAVDQAGVGITVRQEGEGFTVDAYAPRQYPRTLTEASGIVRSWEWTRSAPKATRTVGGAQGEAEARDFFGPLIDFASETAWGDVVEVFTDARNSGDATAAMATKLADGAATAGLKVTLSETSTFRYGTAVRVGDHVRMEVGPGIVVDDVLREATLEWTPRDGLKVSPVIGDRSDTATIYARALATLAAGLRNLSAGR